LAIYGLADHKKGSGSGQALEHRLQDSVSRYFESLRDFDNSSMLAGGQLLIPALSSCRSYLPSEYVCVGLSSDLWQKQSRVCRDG